MSINNLNLVTLPANNSEFTKIEYLLRLSLGATTPVVSSIKSLAKQKTDFERLVSKNNMLTVPCFIDVTKLSEDLNKIAERGFDFP